jgi:hypothetical protein
MSTENSTPILTAQRATEGHKNAIHLVSFFFTYTAKEIADNAEKFKFWKDVLLEKTELDNADSRKELIRIGELLDAMTVLSGKFSEEQIKETITTLDAMLISCLPVNLNEE